MRDALGHTYILREYRRHQVGQQWWSVVNTDVDGLVLEGVIFARGKLTHHLGRTTDPQQIGGAFSAEVFALSAFDVGQLRCPHDHEMPSPFSAALNDGPRDQQRLHQYEEHVAAQPVLTTLQIARRFLVSSIALPTLR